LLTAIGLSPGGSIPGHSRITVVVSVTLRQKHENSIRWTYFVQYILSFNIRLLSEDCWSCYVPRICSISTSVITLQLE